MKSAERLNYILLQTKIANFAVKDTGEHVFSGKKNDGFFRPNWRERLK